MLAGIFRSFCACSIAVVASPRDEPGDEIEGDRNDRKLSLTVYRKWRGSGLKMRKRAERHGTAVGRGNVDVLQLAWMCLKVRQGLQDDVILIGLCERVSRSGAGQRRRRVSSINLPAA